MYYPSLQNMKHHQIEAFNNIKAMLRQGKIPAGLINPKLIKEHNDNSPAVAKIEHSSDDLSLDALAILYAADGVASRKHWRDTVHHKEPTREEPIEELNLGALSRRERLTALGVHDD